MSWLYSQALVEEFSEATSSGGEPSAQLNVMPTLHPFWRNDKPMDVSRLSRFGLTCAALTEQHGADLLTWFRAGFRARTSASQEAEQDSTAPGQDSGEKWSGSFAKWSPNGFSRRTPQLSFLEDSEPSWVTWPRSGLMRRGECYPLETLEHRTSESASGLWLTPCATDAKPITGGNLYQTTTGSVRHMRPDGKSTNRGLAAQVSWPTPTVCGNYNRKGSSAASGDGLATAVKNWATPCARDFRHPGRSRLERTGSKSGDPLPQQIGGPLNPTWVEWLMGWPLGWTDLKPSGTDRFHEWQQQHSLNSQQPWSEAA